MFHSREDFIRFYPGAGGFLPLLCLPGPQSLQRKHQRREVPGCQGDLNNIEQKTSIRWGGRWYNQSHQQSSRECNNVGNVKQDPELFPSRLLVLIRSLSKIMEKGFDWFFFLFGACFVLFLVFVLTDGWCVACRKWAALSWDTDIMVQSTQSSHIPLSPQFCQFPALFSGWAGRRCCRNSQYSLVRRRQSRAEVLQWAEHREVQ